MSAGDDFKNAITTYSGDATTLFNTGHAALPPPSIPSGIPDDDRQKRAQGYLGAGFSQLGQAAQMESTQIGRDGYAAIVELMKTTSSTAHAICTRIQTIVAGGAISSADFAVLSAMNEALKALAQLSPASVWADLSSSS
jgi:hypothetical protein